MPPQRDEDRIAWLRQWAVFLDSRFRVPGTDLRFGMDAVLGLVPGFGDLASPAYTALLLLEGVRRRVPAVIQLRMVLNAAIDMLLGLVPLAGDLVDVTLKSNLRNLTLLERYTTPGVPPRAADYLFVGVCLALIFLIATIPFVILVHLLRTVPIL